MVQLSTYMVATTAMIMGLSTLDAAAAEKIQLALENAAVLPASACAPASASASAIEENRIHADNLLEHLIDDIATFFHNVIHPNLEVVDEDFDAPLARMSASVNARLASASASVKSNAFKSALPVSVAAQNNIHAEHALAAGSQFEKRAIYNLNGEYAEPMVSASSQHNVYSAQDIASVVPSASMKAVLRAHRSALQAAKASHLSASPSASAPAFRSITPEMLEYASLVRRALSPEMTEAADFSEAQFGFIGDFFSFIGGIVEGALSALDGNGFHFPSASAPASAATSAAGSAASAATSAASTSAAGAATSAAGAATSAAGAVVSGATSAAGAATSAAGDLVSGATSAAGAIISGATSAVGAVVGAIQLPSPAAVVAPIKAN